MWRSNASFVIVENYSSISSLAAALVARLRGKSVFLRGEATFRANQTGLFRIAKRLYLRALFPVYSGFMYSCRANRAFYEAHGVGAHRLVFVPSAVDESVFGWMSEEQRKMYRRVLRVEHGLPEQMVVILGVGRLVPRKNWEETLLAFKLARKQESMLTLLIVGDGPGRSGLEQQVDEELSRSVRFLGFKSQAEIAQLYCVGDMLVQSSLYDPSPKVLNEALLAGLPLIVSDRVGTAGDVCVDGENGFVYTSGRIDELSEKFVRLARDEKLRQRFSQGSRELSKIWSIENGVRNIVEAVS
jgi:glycosyltransferase involved in cell wall biosynthesis